MLLSRPHPDLRMWNGTSDFIKPPGVWCREYTDPFLRNIVSKDCAVPLVSQQPCKRSVSSPRLQIRKQAQCDEASGPRSQHRCMSWLAKQPAPFYREPCLRENGKMGCAKFRETLQVSVSCEWTRSFSPIQDSTHPILGQNQKCSFLLSFFPEGDVLFCSLKVEF